MPNVLAGLVPNVPAPSYPHACVLRIRERLASTGKSGSRFQGGRPNTAMREYSLHCRLLVQLPRQGFLVSLLPRTYLLPYMVCVGKAVHPRHSLQAAILPYGYALVHGSTPDGPYASPWGFT